MKLAENKEKGQELLTLLCEKSWDDNQFLKDLQSYPRETIKKATDGKVELKEDHNIVVEDQTDESKIYINIPRKVNLNDFELTDEEMEKVAGGIIGGTVLIAAGLVALGYGIAAYFDKKK